jgi:chaperonin GroEL
VILAVDQLRAISARSPDQLVTIDSRVQAQLAGRALDLDLHEYLVAPGLTDPTKVVRCGLSSAASVATLLLTTGALVSDSPDSKARR